jgi:hypothetical protein
VLDDPKSDLVTRIEAGEAADPAALSDDVLVVVLDGWGDRRKPGYQPFEDELLDRARAGNVHCQRYIFRRLQSCFMRGEITRGFYLERAEPFARLAAEHGDELDRVGWAGFLAVKAAWMDGDGGVTNADAIVASIAEAMLVLARLINGGADYLTSEYLWIRRVSPPEVIARVDAELAVDGLMTIQELEPEVAAKLEQGQ